LKVENEGLVVPDPHVLEWLDDGYHKFHGSPPKRPACRVQVPAGLKQSFAARSLKPPRAMPRSQESNGVPSRRSECVEMEEFQCNGIGIPNDPGKDTLGLRRF
jgi:hypothetical protein